MAGLKCAPETWPRAYAMVSTVRPKASETPSHWTFSLASTAVPQPPKTSQNVPKNSAARRCGLLCMECPLGSWLVVAEAVYWSCRLYLR